MSSTQSLTTLLEHAEAERDAALAALRNIEAAAAAAQGQLDQLQEYRTQYQQRWTTQFRQAGSIELMQCYQGFAQRLDQAINQQSQVVGGAGPRAPPARAGGLGRDPRGAAGRPREVRRQQEQNRVAERRDQRATDEAAQRSRANSASRLSPSMI